ncbi:uncharacterized protein B0I36DRAFT_353632 [Microdochium trichocladiopsis]|uniref:Uncharacterized protein n=1 Tax=Microdochium trichocladiopsis TaxID=1682393 RepID=A0A9P8XVG0_9PEZI|nr:uncharacterized protein B0I36DRAFT_353632 [Microdochium trichocladiopsis]KAH7020898.1 hypothetical protein B0I36DRAFT_353632 [Microdochium trichocladiopsis]
MTSVASQTIPVALSSLYTPTVDTPPGDDPRSDLSNIPIDAIVSVEGTSVLDYSDEYRQSVGRDDYAQGPRTSIQLTFGRFTPGRILIQAYLKENECSLVKLENGVVRRSEEILATIAIPLSALETRPVIEWYNDVGPINEASPAAYHRIVGRVNSGAFTVKIYDRSSRNADTVVQQNPLASERSELYEIDFFISNEQFLLK